MSRTTNDWGCYNCGKRINTTEGGIVICPECGTGLSGVVVFYTQDDQGNTVTHYPDGRTVRDINILLRKTKEHE